MDISELVNLAQKGHKESRYLLRSTPGLYTTKLYELASLISQNKNRTPQSKTPFLINRNDLKDISIQFHSKAGTLTDNVQKNLELFINDVPTLRIAHQPNTFGYLGIYGQFIFLDTVAQNLFTQHNMLSSQVYLVVDFDNAGDKRFRTNHFPCVDRRNGSLSLSSKIPSDSFGKVQFAIEKPSEKQIDQWISSMERLINNNLKILRRTDIPNIQANKVWERFGILRQEIWETHSRTTTLSEFNAVFMSRIINIYWNMSVAFFPSSHVAPIMQRCYEYILQQYPIAVELSSEIVAELNASNILLPKQLRLEEKKFPFWYICPKCSTRINLEQISSIYLTVTGVCRACGSKYQFDLGTYSEPNLTSVYDRIIPKVIIDDLTDIVGWGVVGGSGYIGSVEHMLVSGLLASKLGWHVPFDSVWHPTGVYSGLVEYRVLAMIQKHGYQQHNLPEKAKQALERSFSGKATILYYILSQGFDGLVQMWRNHFENGASLYDFNMGYNNIAPIKNLQEILDFKKFIL